MWGVLEFFPFKWLGWIVQQHPLVEPDKNAACPEHSSLSLLPAVTLLSWLDLPSNLFAPPHHTTSRSVFLSVFHTKKAQYDPSDLLVKYLDGRFQSL